MGATPVRRVVLVPLKPFAVGKQRLRAALSDGEAETLMRSLAERTIVACHPLACWIICEDDDVAAFAEINGAKAFLQRQPGLNEGVSEAYASASHEYDVIVIAHADLATPASLSELPISEGITLVTDRHGTGTNVLVLPAGLPFTFRYGPNSASLHEAEASRLSISFQRIENSPWSHDVDEPTDL